MRLFRANNRPLPRRSSDSSSFQEWLHREAESRSDFEIVFGDVPGDLDLPIRSLTRVPEADLGMTNTKDELCICHGTLADMVALERKYRLARRRTDEPLRTFPNISLVKFMDHNSSCHICQPIRWHLRAELHSSTYIDDLGEALKRPIAIMTSGKRKERLGLHLLSVSADIQTTENAIYGLSVSNFIAESLLALQFFAYKAPALDRIPLVIGHIQQDIDGQGAVSCIWQWLDECRTSHDCGPTSALLPTRLIDVGTIVEPKFRLRLSVDLGETTADYIALSYSWGGYQGFVLTGDHLIKLQQGLDEEALPKTFSDAARLTRGLGIRYIWIDALCIIQDSVDDWKTESRRMHEVYGNAVLTLSAANSSSTTEGFLRSREPQTTTKSHIGTVTHEDEEFHVYVGPPRHTFVEQLRSTKSGPLRTEPLFKRGWTVQERQLSKRIVHFTTHRLIWKCHKVTLFEDGEYGDEDEDLEPLGGEEADRYWFDIVTEFSACALTKASDRLPAIAGLASALESMKGDNYLDGHWQDNLFRSLLWEGDESGRNEDHAAPSWSWASSKGSVTWKGMERGIVPGLNYAARLLSVSRTDGPVKLKMNLPLVDIELRRHRDRKDEAISATLMTRAHWPRLSLLSGYTILDTDMPSWWDLSDLQPGQTSKAVVKKCTLAWLLSDEDSPILSCLLLELVDHDKREYRRIGKCRITHVTRLQRRTFFLSREDIVLV